MVIFYMTLYDHIDKNKRKTNLLIALFLSTIIGLALLLQVSLQYNYSIVVIAVLFSIATSIYGYYRSDTVALKSSGAKEIQKEDNPYLYRMVENLAISAGLPMPRVHIIPSQALNAFATGRDPEHASVAVTQGLLDALENEELEGVLAHELAHIQNYDIRVMTIVVVLVGAISIIADYTLRFGLFGGKNNNKSSNLPLMLLGILALIVSPIVANLIKLAISRKREYLADATGALMTRYPEGLARALEKIQASSVPLSQAHGATAHLFISNPFKSKTFSSVFSTHPPAEERIKRLRAM
jgi:heat shock protein HtpX